MIIRPKEIFWTAALIFWVQALSGCSYERMYDQEYVRTYKAAVPEMPPGTVPISGGLAGLMHTDPKTLKTPFPSGPESLAQGKDAYLYFCVQCHGPRADGKGTVGQSFFPLPTNLASPAIQGQSDGELFHKISLGFKRHPPLASTVSEEDRWSVVNYIRSLLKKG
jgi:mono/diheme cytochrome c family protein